MGHESPKEMKSALGVKATLISGFHNSSSPILPSPNGFSSSFLPSATN